MPLQSARDHYAGPVYANEKLQLTAEDWLHFDDLLRRAEAIGLVPPQFKSIQ